MKLPQLSLRELFLLVLVAACLCGWWAERSKGMVSQEQAAESAARADQAESKSAALAERLRLVEQAVFQIGFVVNLREDARTKQIIGATLGPRDDTPFPSTSRIR